MPGAVPMPEANVSSLKHASTVLGLKTLEELIVVAGSTKSLSNRMEGYGMEAGDLWPHSLGVAFGSKITAARMNPGMANDAFSAGLIPDVESSSWTPTSWRERMPS